MTNIDIILEILRNIPLEWQSLDIIRNLCLVHSDFYESLISTSFWDKYNLERGDDHLMIRIRWAAKHGCIQCLKSLDRKGKLSDGDAKNADVALSEAVYRANITSIKYLLEKTKAYDRDGVLSNYIYNKYLTSNNNHDKNHYLAIFDLFLKNNHSNLSYWLNIYRQRAKETNDHGLNDILNKYC